MSVLVNFSIFPINRGESLSPFVAKAVGIIEASGLSYQLGPMGTAIEGEWSEVIQVVSSCFEALQADSDRIYMTVHADYRKDGTGRIKSKVSSVRDKLTYRPPHK